MDMVSISSKNSNKTMEDPERDLNQDAEEEGQNSNYDVITNIDDFLRQIMEEQKRKHKESF